MSSYGTHLLPFFLKSDELVASLLPVCTVSQFLCLVYELLFLFEIGIGVKVANVNTINVKPKAKRVGRYTGFTNKTKKAIITLTADSKAIELFAAEAE